MRCEIPAFFAARETIFAMEVALYCGGGFVLRKGRFSAGRSERILSGVEGVIEEAEACGLYPIFLDVYEW